MENGDYKNKWPHPYWARFPIGLLAFFVASVLLGAAVVRILYPDQWYDVELISEPVSMQVFANSAEETPQTLQSNRLCVWVETSASMAGYLSDTRRSNYPETFFEQLVRYPARMLGRASSGMEIVQYAFDSSFTSRLNRGTQSVEEVLESYQITSGDSILNADYFLSDQNTSANALAGVFEVMDTTCVNVIITDFLESRQALASLDALQKSFEPAFRDNRTIDVIGLEDAFSGFLFEVGDNGEVLSFGAGNKTGYTISGDTVRYSSNAVSRISGSPVSLGSYIKDPHPRPLYVIVVGLSEQCDMISNTIMELYEQYRTRINNSKDICLHAKGSSDSQILPKAQKLSLARASLFEVASKVDGSLISGGISEADGKYKKTTEEFDYQKQLLHGDGVDAYRFFKDESKRAQTYTLTYLVKPQVENYRQNWSDDLYSTGQLSLQRLAFRPAGIGGEMQNKVHTLGDCYLQYAVEPFSGGGAVQISGFETSQEGILVSVTVDVSSMSSGYYHMDIPVQLSRHVLNIVNTLDESELAVWFGNSGGFTSAPYQTPNLKTQLQRLCGAQQASLEENVRVATIRIDFEITNKSPMEGE